MFAKTVIIATLATLTLGGVIKRDDNYQQVIIPQDETFDQFTLSWKAECDKLFFASEGGVYTNATFVEPASTPADALVYCGWYTERPTVVYDNTVECANALGVQFA
ncbi:hypothetical protein DFH09DRAFT_1250050 [Mycena vulgaris]|nr:hypothetical protein DFH09DRAFT_1250050 [Mycena vulgaris]